MDSNKSVTKILLVSGVQENLDRLAEMLEGQGYHLEKAGNGGEALGKSSDSPPDLIMLDAELPDINGFEICKRLKEDQRTGHIPVLMMASPEDDKARIKGFAVGANDFVTSQVKRTELVVRVKNLLKMKEYEDYLNSYNERLEVEISKQTEELKKTMISLSMSKENMKRGYLDIIYKLTVIAEFSERQTAAHIKRIGLYCRLFAEDMGWPEAEREIISFAGPMHDIGKIAIPSEILLKPTALSPEEFETVKTHTEIGAGILHGSSVKYLNIAEIIALTHHENWDGSGYPKGLEGDQIPIEGRIASIADHYDALRSFRPYKVPVDHPTACKALMEGDDKTTPGNFDPHLLQIFDRIGGRLAEVFEENQF